MQTTTAEVTTTTQVTTMAETEAPTGAPSPSPTIGATPVVGGNVTMSPTTFVEVVSTPPPTDPTTEIPPADVETPTDADRSTSG